LRPSNFYLQLIKFGKFKFKFQFKNTKSAKGDLKIQINQPQSKGQQKKEEQMFTSIRQGENFGASPTLAINKTGDYYLPRGHPYKTNKNIKIKLAGGHPSKTNKIK